jgi:hypothetical protein
LEYCFFLIPPAGQPVGYKSDKKGLLKNNSPRIGASHQCFARGLLFLKAFYEQHGA